MDEKQPALITNDAVVLGILLIVLALVVYTSGSSRRGWTKFYKVVPGILLCYFIPAMLNTFGIINGADSPLYTIASRYFLPASLVLLTLSIDIPALKKLGSKSVVMFLAGSFGVLIGGPLALLIAGSINPDILLHNDEETWRGLATIAGSWIGGGANQAALLEIFGASKTLFGQMVVIDVVVAYIWMGLLLYGAQRPALLDKWLKADSSGITDLQQRMELKEKENARSPRGSREWLMLLGMAFGITALAHAFADFITPWISTNYPHLSKYSLTSGFFWIIIISTTAGLLASFTRLRRLETHGASDLGSVFLYLLVATIGMQMDLKSLFTNPGFFSVAVIWILFHITFMIIVARIIKAPFFFVAVGSQANIGGPVSAPIIAAAFNKHLAPVGVMMAILGYAVGTYAGYLCGLGLQFVSDILR